MPSPVEIAKRKLTRTTHHIHTLPVVVLMPHSKCNCRCVMCDIWKANRNGQEIDAEALAPHLEDFQRLNVQQVVLSGGEALMHSNLWALCEGLRKLKVKITLLSTGLLLKRHAEQIITNCDEVIVSLDGSRDVHDLIRRIPNAYDRLVEGVAALKALDADFGVTGRSVLQRMNYSDMPNIIMSAQDMGLDQISFLAADVSTEAFNRPDGWDQERVDDVALTPDELREFEHVLDAVIQSFAAEFASGYIAESPAKLRKIVQYYQALCGLKDLPTVHCNAPWVSTVIEADGTVRPCFFHEALGNIHDQPLIDILNAEQAVQFRRGLNVQQDSICKKCVCTLSLGLRADV